MWPGGGSGRGLFNLIELTLPKRSFVTHSGLRVVLESLPFLERLRNAGNIGLVFEDDDYLPENTLNLMEFDQTRSVTIEEDGMAINAWMPTPSTAFKVFYSCPNLDTIKILSSEKQLMVLAEVLAEIEEDVAIKELEVHATWEPFQIGGLDLVAIAIGQYLNRLYLTLLDGYSWIIIKVVSEQCLVLERFHLEIWNENIEDEQVLQQEQVTRFPNLKDLKIKCEMYVDHLTPLLFDWVFGTRSNLTTAQYIAPLDWLTHHNISETIVKNHSSSLEMLIISNTKTNGSNPQDEEDGMRLGLEIVDYLLDKCPGISVIGNLKTWAKVDYYDPSNENYYRSKESGLGKLKQQAMDENWDLDLDLENLDFMYNVR